MYEAVLDFWFNTLTPQQWWQKNDELDTQIREQFGQLHKQASQGELAVWRETPAGRLAEVIILDQFSRNIYRDNAQAYAYDGMALVLAQEAIRVQADQSLAATQRAFLYLPFMHSESVNIHQQAVELFSAPGLETNLKFELEHKAIIDRFHRYPHRNAVLGRVSTQAELKFLQQLKV